MSTGSQPQIQQACTNNCPRTSTEKYAGITYSKHIVMFIISKLECPSFNTRITDTLGSGQFGQVEKGLWQSPLGAKPVAVKTLIVQKEGIDRDEDEVRFLQEAAINGQFQHPNVVKLYGVVTLGKPVSF